MKSELSMETINNGIRYTLHGDYNFPNFNCNFDSLGWIAQNGPTARGILFYIRIDW